VRSIFFSFRVSFFTFLVNIKMSNPEFSFLSDFTKDQCQSAKTQVAEKLELVINEVVSSTILKTVEFATANQTGNADLKNIIFIQNLRTQVQDLEQKLELQQKFSNLELQKIESESRSYATQLNQTQLQMEMKIREESVKIREETQAIHNVKNEENIKQIAKLECEKEIITNQLRNNSCEELKYKNFEMDNEKLKYEKERAISQNEQSQKELLRLVNIETRCQKLERNIVELELKPCKVKEEIEYLCNDLAKKNALLEYENQKILTEFNNISSKLKSSASIGEAFENTIKGLLEFHFGHYFEIIDVSGQKENGDIRMVSREHAFYGIDLSEEKILESDNENTENTKVSQEKMQIFIECKYRQASKAHYSAPPGETNKFHDEWRASGCDGGIFFTEQQVHSSLCMPFLVQNGGLEILVGGGDQRLLIKAVQTVLINALILRKMGKQSYPGIAEIKQAFNHLVEMWTIPDQIIFKMAKQVQSNFLDYQKNAGTSHLDKTIQSLRTVQKIMPEVISDDLFKSLAQNRSVSCQKARIEKLENNLEEKKGRKRKQENEIY